MTTAVTRVGAATLLIVDDVPPVLAWARRVFTHSGWRVLSAEDGDTALRLWDHERQSGAVPDLLITDVGLPGMNGTELMRQIRSRSPEVPIIVISGLPSDEVTWGAMPHDRVLFLRKPVTGASLLAAARGLCDDAWSAPAEDSPA